MRGKAVTKRWEQCEWCEEIATWKIVADDNPEYRRFSCEEHYGKTQKLVSMDGHSATFTIVFQSNGYEL